LRHARLLRLLFVALFLALLIAAMWNLGFFDLTRLEKVSNLGVFLRDLFPPDPDVLGEASRALFETVQMAFVGTALSFILALPLGLLGARNLFGAKVTAPVRLALSVVRTVPVLLWALILVVTIGLGPLAGTIGLAIYSLGYLGKLYYEGFEAVDPEVTEAVKSVGCSKLQLARYAIIPESANMLLSQLLFMFEYNVRASSILGFVGAGGIGFYMLGYIQALQYQSLLTVILLTLAVVLLIDFLSTKIRDRFLLTNPAQGGGLLMSLRLPKFQRRPARSRSETVPEVVSAE